MSRLEVMRVRRDKDGPRVSAAVVHSDPAHLRPSSPQEAPLPDLWVDACRTAGLLPTDGTPASPGSPTTDDDEAMQRPSEHSTVGVFRSRADRFPLVPVARGFRSGTTTERVWVGAAPSAGHGAPQGSDGATVYVAHYGRLMDQVLDEVTVAEGGAGVVAPETRLKTTAKKTTAKKKQWRPTDAAKAPAKAKKKKKGVLDSDSDSSLDLTIFD